MFVLISLNLMFPVDLPNGLEVWWDGITRVYIDAPARFQGNTKVQGINMSLLKICQSLTHSFCFFVPLLSRLEIHGSTHSCKAFLFSCFENCIFIIFYGINFIPSSNLYK